MNARKAQSGHPHRTNLQPPDLDDAPITEKAPHGDTLCPICLPDTNIPCGKHVHRENVACTGSGERVIDGVRWRYAAFWWRVT